MISTALDIPRPLSARAVAPVRRAVRADDPPPQPRGDERRRPLRFAEARAPVAVFAHAPWQDLGWGCAAYARTMAGPDLPPGLMLDRRA